MDGATATVSGLGNTTTAYDGFANGKGKAATEEQLKEVATEAGKHTTLVAGDNVQVKEEKTDNGLKYTVSATDTTYTAGNGIAINGENNAISVKLKAGEGNLVVDKDGLALNKDLQDIASISNGSVKLALDSATETAGLINGKGASVFLMNDSTVINGAVGIDKNGKISGVAAGKISADSTDAVNGSQLNAVATEASKHSKVVNGSNTNVEETTVDGQKVYKVNLNKNIMVGDVTGKYVSISGTNGTIEATGAIATKDRVYADKGGKLADIDVTGNTISNGDAKLALNGAAGTVGMINGKGASVYMQGSTTVINSKVSVDKDGKISGLAAGKISADSTDAVNGSQLHAVATEAGKHSKVVNGSNTNVEETTVDGQKVYKVNLNNNIMVGDITGKYVSISGTNGTIETTGYIATKDRVYADKGAKLADIDVTGNKISNGASSIVLDGSNVKVNDKVTIDQNGNIAGVNSIQTNALNAKYNLSVGTANENGIMPFFVNSNGAFYGANNNFSVDKDGKVTATAGEIGNVVLQNGVFTGHSALRDGELFVGDASGNYSQITTKGAKLGKVTVAADGKISGVAAGEVSSTSTDAINGSQLHQTNENVAALDKRVTQNEADIATNKANIAQNAADIAQNKADIAANRADIDKNKADIAQNKADIAQNKADIAQNKADIAQNKTDIKNLDNRVTNVEELAKKHTTVTAGDNITVTEDTNKDGGKEYKVALDKDIKLDSVTTGQTVMNNDGLKVGKDVSVTATAVTAGKTSISDEGVKVGDKTYISDKGLNANGQQITNVADGKENSDAVNYGQLKGVENQVVSNTNRINQLGSRVNKVGAGAAALAALHPMDFDPDDKLTFSAGYGNYAGENAAAIGAYYRPDEKVMFSVAGTVGNGENMVNAGVSFALDRTNHVSNSRTALAREVIDLRGQLAVMGAKMAKMEKAFGMLDETKTKLFPDVPANHWAYEYIAKLAGNGYIEGYPDGNFGGDRLMTRYEFAAMLYRAIENGAALEEKIIKEFEPELGRIRVDRISGEDGDRDKIERVRVNDTKGERDHYGNKLAK